MHVVISKKSEEVDIIFNPIAKKKISCKKSQSVRITYGQTSILPVFLPFSF